jgi:two-component system, OmpR family, KDP operon response regulator KdpE
MAQTIAAGLAARGYDIRARVTGRAALDLCSEIEPDVVLLDLGLPDIDGVEVCRHLRRWTQAPIIVLTADGSEARKVEALDQGADDYITKPFSMVELNARLRVALRHRALLASVVGGKTLTIGSLTVDIDGRAAAVAGRPLDLTRLEFRLLSLLALNCGKVLTHTHLRAHVWESNPPSVGGLRTQMFGVRHKLGAGAGVPRILTESGIGYRMLEPD